MGKDRVVWPRGAELLLIELWAENIKELRSHRKNGHIYREIAGQMKSKTGIALEGKDIQVKISNLTQKYKNERKLIGSGGIPSIWPLYLEIDKVLGTSRYNISCIDSVSNSEKQDEIYEALSATEPERIDSDYSKPAVLRPQTPRIYVQHPKQSRLKQSEYKSGINSASVSNAFKIEHPLKKKKNKLGKALLSEMKKLNKVATKLMKEANEIEKKKADILESFAVKSLEIQQKLLEIAQNK